MVNVLTVVTDDIKEGFNLEQDPVAKDGQILVELLIFTPSNSKAKKDCSSFLVCCIKLLDNHVVRFVRSTKNIGSYNFLCSVVGRCLGEKSTEDLLLLVCVRTHSV